MGSGSREPIYLPISLKLIEDTQSICYDTWKILGPPPPHDKSWDMLEQSILRHWLSDTWPISISASSWINDLPFTALWHNVINAPCICDSDSLRRQHSDIISILWNLMKVRESYREDIGAPPSQFFTEIYKELNESDVHSSLQKNLQLPQASTSDSKSDSKQWPRTTRA